ncbi:MAG: methionine adenosyltransferase [Candidatus Hodarchaeota archaeon]
MTRNIAVARTQALPIEQQHLEIVERKGKGHPDTILDAVVEDVGVTLCNYYIDNFGRILHHNVDKGSIAGGRAQVDFGGGDLLEPIYLCVVGRATTEVFKNGDFVRIPIGTLTLQSIKKTIKKTLRFLDPTEHMMMDYRIKPGSADLAHVFDRVIDDVPRANDTSFGVGFAPLSETEELVFQTEQLLNSDAFKRKHPEVGEDVKVMGLRTDNEIKLTVAAAMIAPYIPDADHYNGVLKEVSSAVLDQAKKITEREVSVVVNSADDPQRGSYYLTITGTSAEMGDDAGVGRGNRVNGLITPCRPMSLEAAAGKNPQNHVGKIYNVLAQRAADRIVKEESRVLEAYVKILTRIGYPIDEPLIASAEIIPNANSSWNDVQANVTSILDAELEDVCSIQQLILDKKARLF